MSRRLVLALVLAAAEALAAGCTANLPDGRFRCNADPDCPTPLRCRASEHLCYRDVTPGADTGTPIDAGVVDANVPVDAWVCEDCVTVTLTNAYAPLNDDTYHFETQTDGNVPSFGETAGPIEVSLGDGVLDFTSSFGPAEPTHFTPVVVGRSYVLAIVYDPAAPNIPRVIMLQAPTTVPAAGRAIARPVDAIHDSETHGLPDPAGGGQLLSRTVGNSDFDFDGTTPPAMLTRFNATPPGDPGTPLAALDYGQLPRDLAYYLFVVGRADEHLGAAEGLRFVPAIPGGAAFPSLPLVWTMNTTTTAVAICDGTTLLATVPASTLQGAFPGVFTSHNYRAFDATSSAGCTSAIATSFTLPQLPDTMLTGRLVISVIGTVASGTPPTWGAGGGYEGPPDDATGRQVITYANGVPGAMLQFGTSAMPDVVSVPMFEARSHAWPTPPTDLTIRVAGMSLLHFSYLPPPAGLRTMAILGLVDGTMIRAYVVQTPFGDDWNFTSSLGS